MLYAVQGTYLLLKICIFTGSALCRTNSLPVKRRQHPVDISTKPRSPKLAGAQVCESGIQRCGLRSVQIRVVQNIRLKKIVCKAKAEECVATQTKLALQKRWACAICDGLGAPGPDVLWLGDRGDLVVIGRAAGLVEHKGIEFQRHEHVRGGHCCMYFYFCSCSGDECSNILQPHSANSGNVRVRGRGLVIAICIL